MREQSAELENLARLQAEQRQLRQAVRRALLMIVRELERQEQEETIKESCKE